jgi:hypothetical protein
MRRTLIHMYRKSRQQIKIVIKNTQENLSNRKKINTTSKQLLKKTNKRFKKKKGNEFTINDKL